MKFTEYNIIPEIKKVLGQMGLEKPTDIQYKAIPPILRGEDVLAIAQTGTGKTAAFGIPVINQLAIRKIPGRPDGIKCVVMAPTRELALQLTEVLKGIAQHTALNIFCVYGGVEQDRQIQKLEKGIDIMVATPGRMFDLVYQGYIRFNRVQFLILDEADHMLDKGFFKDIQDIIKFLPSRRQTLFFSATIDEKIKELAYSIVKNPIRIQISPKDPVSKNVKHSVAFVGMDDKRFFLERVIRENEESKILVFVRTQVRAERVKSAMERVKIDTVTIHGGKEQDERQQALSDFKSGRCKVMIATDVSARGIDIKNVEYVVNYDLPDRPENYVHRVGRTGRGKEKGTAVSFCSPEEKLLLRDIEDYMLVPVKVLNIEKNDYIDTIDFTEDESDNWKKLIRDSEREMEIGLSKKRKKKK